MTGRAAGARGRTAIRQRRPRADGLDSGDGDEEPDGGLRRRGCAHEASVDAVA